MISKIQRDVLVLFKCITDFGEDILRNFTKDRLASSGLWSAFLKENKHILYHQWDKKKISCCECPKDGCDIPKTGNMYQNIFDKFYLLDNSFHPLKGHYIRNGTNIAKQCICQYKEKPIAHVDICDMNGLLCYLNLILPTEESVLKAFVSLRSRVCDAFYTEMISETELSSLWPQFTEVIYTIYMFQNDPKYLRVLQKAIEATKRNLLSEEEVTELMEKIAAVKNIVHTNEEEMKNIIEDGTTEQNNISAGMQNGHEDPNDKKSKPKEKHHKCNELIQDNKEKVCQTVQSIKEYIVTNVVNEGLATRENVDEQLHCCKSKQAASTLTKKDKKDKKKERQKRNQEEKRNPVGKRKNSNSSSTPNKEVEQIQTLLQASSSNTSIENATIEVSQPLVSHPTGFKNEGWLPNNKALSDTITESQSITTPNNSADKSQSSSNEDENREDDSTIHSGTCEFRTDETDIAEQKPAPSVLKAELDVRPKQPSLYKNLTKWDWHTGISDNGLSIALHEKSSYIATTKKKETFNPVQHTPMGFEMSVRKQSDKERRLETAGVQTVTKTKALSKWSFPPKPKENDTEQKINEDSKGYSKDIRSDKTLVEPYLSNEEKLNTDDSQDPDQRSAQSYFQSSNKSMKSHTPPKIELNEKDKLHKCVSDVCQPLLQDRLELTVELKTRQNFADYLETYKHYFYHQLPEGANLTSHCTKLSTNRKCVYVERGNRKIGNLTEAVFKNLYNKKSKSCKCGRGENSLICLHTFQPKIRSIKELDFNDLQFFLLECDKDISECPSKKRSLKEIVDLRNNLSHPKSSKSVSFLKNPKNVWKQLKDNICNLYIGNMSVELIIWQVECIQQSTTDSGNGDSMNELVHFLSQSNQEETFIYDMYDENIKVKIKMSFDESRNQTDEQTMRRVIWKIDTTNNLDHKTDEMIELVRKAAKSANVWSPYTIECVESGCIRLCTLLPITWLDTESDFRLSVRNFLDQIVRTCNISTGNPLEMDVKIVIQEYTDHALVHYGERHRTNLKVYDRATQATVVANDKQTHVTSSDLDSYNQYTIDELASAPEYDQLHYETTDDTQAKRIGTNHNTNDDEIIAVQDMNPHDYETFTHLRHIVDAGSGIHYVESCNNELSMRLSNSVIPFCFGFGSEIQFEMHRGHGNLYEHVLPIENYLTSYI